MDALREYAVEITLGVRAMQICTCNEFGGAFGKFALGRWSLMKFLRRAKLLGQVFADVDLGAVS